MIVFFTPRRRRLNDAKTPRGWYVSGPPPTPFCQNAAADFQFVGAHVWVDLTISNNSSKHIFTFPVPYSLKCLLFFYNFHSFSADGLPSPQNVYQLKRNEKRHLTLSSHPQYNVREDIWNTNFFCLYSRIRHGKQDLQSYIAAIKSRLSASLRCWTSVISKSIWSFTFR